MTAAQMKEALRAIEAKRVLGIPLTERERAMLTLYGKEA